MFIAVTSFFGWESFWEKTKEPSVEFIISIKVHYSIEELDKFLRKERMRGKTGKKYF